MRKFLVLAAAVALAAVPLGSLANDSSAELTNRGLVLTQSPAVEMRSEDLYISAREVRVKYRFANTSAADASMIVAFPMPDITIEGEDDMLAIPTQDPTNILGFTTIVDGRPVQAEVEQKVVKGGVDRTAYLRANGIPLAPHLEATNKVLDALPQAKKDEIIRMGLGQIMEYDSGQGWEKHLYATWTLKTTFWWRQTFPAGRDVLVEHRYTPSVGQTAGTSWGSPYWLKEPRYRETVRRFCVDATFIAAVKNTPRREDVAYAPYTEERIDYVLTTGANWKKPIGEFRLVVDKSDPDSLVSFCGDGVRKISPTQFEVRHTNWIPTRELSILILKRMHGAMGTAQ